MDSDDTQESIYNFVNSDQGRSTFSFHKAPTELLFPAFGPQRSPPTRFSITRLRDWKPAMTDLLILGASNAADIKFLTRSSAKLASEQQATDSFAITEVLDERRGMLPPTVGGDNVGQDSVLIGEALDLSSRNLLERPIPSDHEIDYSEGPVPVYLALNHEGVLSAWWIIYENSIREGTTYPGLPEPPYVHPKDSENEAQPEPPAQPTPPAESPSKPNPFAQPATFGGATSGTPKPNPFGQPSQPAATSTSGFGQPSKPAFGSTGFGKPSVPAFGAPSTPGAASSWGKPSQPAFGASSVPGASPFAAASPSTPGASPFAAAAAKPAFGSASMPGGPGFGAAGGMGKSASPWAAAAQPSPTTATPPNPFASKAGEASGFTKAQPNPFASKAGETSGFVKAQPNPFANKAGESSGFAKFGTGSAFGAPSSSSPFGGLTGQKSAFSGATNQPTLSKEPSSGKSFGSTLSVGSSFGGGSTLPSWANTPAQNGSVFGQAGQNTPSFASSKESADDAQYRGAKEATPTPHAPTEQPKNIFGGFQLGSTFKGDGTAKDDLPKPAVTSLFGNDFVATLGGAGSKPPATPIKKEEKETRLQDISTTPASLPNPSPPAEEESPGGEDAPLPPDPMTWKPKKESNDDLPPIAGSPGIKVEAPSSDIPSSPLEDNESEFSVEEQDEDDEGDEQDEDEDDEGEGEDDGETDGEDEEQDGGDQKEEESPTDAMSRLGRKPAWSFGDILSNSPQIRPAAPTPPAATSSRSGDHSRGESRSPSRSQSVLGQASKPASSSLFGQSATPGGLPAKPLFPPTARKVQEMRSPSPVRSASASSLKNTLRQPLAGSLASSMQSHHPPTPQPELSDLEDQEDERIRQELESEIIPSSTLDKFIAHQDYTGSVTKTGTAGEIERIYRDMNSMVDTLGLNSRSLQSFLAFHTKRRFIPRDDLEEVADQGEEGPWFDKWSIAMIEDLKNKEDQLERELDIGRVQNVVDKMGQLHRLFNDSAKLSTRFNDIRRQIINRQDPERAEALRKAALPKELSDQQKALRNEYARLLTQLNQAEEAVVLLKSKVASNSAANGKPAAVPTMMNVKKTIIKLIQMTEQKNNDIVDMESQLRKLNIGPDLSSSRAFGTPPRTSTRGIQRNNQSPMATPPSKMRMSLSDLNRTVRTPEQPEDTPTNGYGLFYTPQGSPTQDVFESELVRLANEMEKGDLSGLVEAGRRRKGVAAAVGKAVKGRKVRVTTVGGAE